MGLWRWLTGERAAPSATSLESSFDARLPDGSSADGGEAAASTPAAGRPTGGWQAVPAIQRVLGDIAPTVRPAQFSGSLTTWHDPTLVQELVHGVSPLAPSGLVSGLAKPVPGTGPGSHGLQRMPADPEPSLAWATPARRVRGVRPEQSESSLGADEDVGGGASGRRGSAGRDPSGQPAAPRLRPTPARTRRNPGIPGQVHGFAGLRTPARPAAPPAARDRHAGACHRVRGGSRRASPPSGRRRSCSATQRRMTPSAGRPPSTRPASGRRSTSPPTSPRSCPERSCRSDRPAGRGRWRRPPSHVDSGSAPRCRTRPHCRRSPSRRPGSRNHRESLR